MDTGPTQNLRAMILIGAPATGKSTWAQAFAANNPGTTIISSDDFIEQAAAENGKTYSEVFDANIKAATEKAEKKLVDNIMAGTTMIIVDRTNMSRKSRAPYLQKLQFHGYRVYAGVFPVPEDKEHARRLTERVGKDIPADVITKMVESYEEPTKEEGFSDIFQFPSNNT
jgi:predicted kinase